MTDFCRLTWKLTLSWFPRQKVSGIFPLTSGLLKKITCVTNTFMIEQMLSTEKQEKQCKYNITLYRGMHFFVTLKEHIHGIYLLTDDHTMNIQYNIQ